MPKPDFRRVAVILHDFFMVAVAGWLALLVRHGFSLALAQWENVGWLPWVVAVQAPVFWYYGLYRGIWRFASLPDLWNILRAVLFGSLLVGVALWLLGYLAQVPGTLLLYPLFLTMLLGLPRLLYRLWKEHSLRYVLDARAPKRVLVLGAGRAGEMLVRDMHRDGEYLPLGFLDDNPRLHGGKVQNVPVLTTINQLPAQVQQLGIDLVFIAMPSASDAQMQRVVEYCEASGKPFRTLPKPSAQGHSRLSLADLQAVSLEDLLGREKIQLNWDIIEAGLSGKTVMVSGGGGSIGAELCRQIARLRPRALVIFERSEYNLYEVDKSLRQVSPETPLYTCLGDVCDPLSVNYALSKYRPDIIFHAAAYKHVPLLQDQIRSAVSNNILGTRTLAEAAVAHACGAFVMVSTDKAVNPSSVMGATKRCAEIFCQALNTRSDTRFITVRFGNVLGSAGSVVPLFREQIARGGPVTVTHPEITRYFMTIPEACQLILQSASMGHGGEIFVLDMGVPMKINYLAEQLIRLAGKEPGKDIEICYTGLRPGEKLHEELFHVEEEQMSRTRHSKIMLASHRPADWTQLQQTLEELQAACSRYDEAQICAGLQKLVPEFHNVTLH